MKNTILTIDFGEVPIRRTHTIGETIAEIELSDGTFADVRRDYRTNQPFAVMLDDEVHYLGKEL